MAGFGALTTVKAGENAQRPGNKSRGKGRASDKIGITTMAADRSQNLQDTFLNHVRKNKTPLTIFLVNGVKLQGVVTWFDNFCVLLRRDGHSQLVYKHAISTVMPGHPIQLFEGTDEQAPGEKA
jgi:host factor-I protein